MAKIPDFKTLDEAVEFWESHDSTDYWEEMEEATFEVNLHQNLLHPRLIVLTHQPEHCPRCRQELESVVIEYVAWNNGHFFVIRDVPALRCQANGHEYILEATLDQVEYLFNLLLNCGKTQHPQPTETIQVPVFSMKMSAYLPGR